MKLRLYTSCEVFSHLEFSWDPFFFVLLNAVQDFCPSASPRSNTLFDVLTLRAPSRTLLRPERFLLLTSRRTAVAKARRALPRQFANVRWRLWGALLFQTGYSRRLPSHLSQVMQKQQTVTWTAS